LKLPNTIGLMLITILFTVGVYGLSFIDNTLLKLEENIIGQVDFRTVLLDVMLSFLLFAGALHTNFENLKTQRWPILVFATIGVLTSTFLVGTGTYYFLQMLHMDVQYIHCLLFGALISPTDPIAVLGILKKAGVPKRLEAKFVGESLFNDGVGVVVFSTIFAFSGGDSIKMADVAILFGKEVIGGLLMGFILGYITFQLLKSIDDYTIEVIGTLATVMVGTAIAHKVGVSAPLAMVTAGLVVGHQNVRASSMSETTESYVDKFWELIDILFNTILFVLIGMEMLVLTFKMNYIYAGGIAVPVVLLCRYLSLYIPIKFFKRRLDFVKHTNFILTWGGLRGGISIAMALSLTEDMHRSLFLVMTYIIVVFSIIVQGLTVGKIVKRITKDEISESRQAEAYK
ncbi:MAG: sodium:proton antiporter, partial [Gillisia sp.]